MRPADLAKRLGISGETIRRWTREYEPYLGPGATRHGQPRSLGEHDQRVLTLIRSLRDAGLEQHQIITRLEEIKKGDYKDLPGLPVEWSMPDVPMHQAANVAQLYAQNATLTVELQNARQALEVASTRVDALTAENAQLRETGADTAEQLNAARLDLERVQGTVARLEAQLEASVPRDELARLEVQLSSTVPRAELTRLEGVLSQYTFGRERPVSVALIVLVTALAVSVVLIILVIVLSLAL